MRIVACLFLAVLVGCARAPIFSSPLEGPNDPYMGSVDSLTKLLDGKSEAYVVFIHGVGDHCPGYAVAPTFGWLNEKAMATMGLSALASPVVNNIPDSEFLPNHDPDPASLVSYTKRDYEYRPDAMPSGAVNVHAIEITWSQLTQWVKMNQLDYDLTQPGDKPPSLALGCPFSPSAQYKKPPARQALNQLLKENTLDRSLVDAVIYAGVYGKAMRRGLAEALCRAFGGEVNGGGAICRWPKPGMDKAAYFFVTHSLGSRLLYDTLVGLEGHDVANGVETFSRQEQTDAQAFLDQLILHTSSIYMMANQLPLLGLAYEEGLTSSDPPHPMLPMLRREAALQGVATPPAAFAGRSSAPTSHPQPSVNGFIALRAQLARDSGQAFPKLTVVAFSDPNDLLSWSIPKWYQDPPDGIKPYATFTNVYLQNSTHWLGIAENPATAHTGYFVSDDVWRVIRCGGSNGHLDACP